jgi:FixJ family two-component response regulator
MLREAAPTIFVVEDDVSVRTAIESLLTSEGLAVRCFGSAREFSTQARVDGPCCLVLDVRLPDASGLELQGELAVRAPGLPIVFISGRGDIPMTVRAMRAGAVEFLSKPFSDQALLDAVHLALGVSRTVWKSQEEGQALQRRFDSLTPREHQVLERVVAGLLNKQIAFELGISEVTVKIHRARVMHKMQAGSVADLVRMSDRIRRQMPGATPSTMVR